MRAIIIALLFVSGCFAQGAATGSVGPTGQQAITGTAAVLVLPQGILNVCVKALPANAIVVYQGNSSAVTTSTGYPLSASEAICLPAPKTSTAAQIYFIASTTGASVAWTSTLQ